MVIPRNPKTVLLLDDSEDLRDLFNAYLTPRGFQIHTAENVSAALAVLKEKGFPDLLLMDFHIGDEDAHHAIACLERSFPTLFTISKVVLYSASPATFTDPRIHAFEPKARDLKGLEAIVRKYT